MDLSLAGWSIHRRFQRDRDPLALLDYPRVTTEEFGLDKAELNSPFFAYENDGDQAVTPFQHGYIDELRKRADDVGVSLVGVAIDDHGDLSAIDETERRKAVDNHRKWFEACNVLGCGALRANSGGEDDPRNPRRIDQCTKSFAQLAAWGGEHGVKVMIENHWGISNYPENLVRIVKGVNSEWFGSLPDFGNFTDDVDPYDALTQIAPYAVFVHAKFFTFDADGESADFDLPRILRIFDEAGYDGTWGIEYEGETDDHEGVVKSIALMKKYGD
jgi:sugar phosphate isomerase/epimerase